MKKGKIVLLDLTVPVVASVGTTWAARFQIIWTGNEYRVPRYRTSLEEHFHQPDDWQPGITVQKQVWVSSNLKAEDDSLENDVPVIVRVGIHQSWIRRKNVHVLDQDGNKTATPPLEGEMLPPDFVTDQGEYQYAAISAPNKEAAMVLRSGVARDAGVRLDPPYADKAEDAGGK